LAPLNRDNWGSTGKGETQWETRAGRKIRKRDRNRTPKNRNKSQIISSISSQKESLDRNHGAEICTTAFAVLIYKGDGSFEDSL
jgi:hypothetical protein